ncbi:hypothetical protein HYS03_01820 [Candidatus Woesebacteria bacterium]|nr:hypothetical protein [Candidatus Woesebacteria bacterium]QQG47892.1 MAG: hypothetical protein HY044_02285 [Candidatus Woesebacteria bacterium]
MKKSKLFPILILSMITNILFAAVVLASGTIKLNLNALRTQSTPTTISKDNLFDETNPVEGFEINAKYGDLGPKMTALGVIDSIKFKEVFEKSNQPLTPDEENILTKGSDQKIKITRDNSYFLLNFFWAVGLTNKSKILDEGDMVKYGGAKAAGNFASTGGWTLAKTDAMNYYSKSPIVKLTQDQEDLVNKVASNIYRPCCNNSTAFPDCNHGMALLGVLEVMAANGETEDQMYEAAKYFNAFWFPGNYYDLAEYFKAKEGKSFKDINARTLLGKDYSSSTGYQTIKQWLTTNNIGDVPPKQGGGCGV